MHAGCPSLQWGACPDPHARSSHPRAFQLAGRTPCRGLHLRPHPQPRRLPPSLPLHLLPPLFLPPIPPSCRRPSGGEERAGSTWSRASALGGLRLGHEEAGTRGWRSGRAPPLPPSCCLLLPTSPRSPAAEPVGAISACACVHAPIWSLSSNEVSRRPPRGGVCVPRVLAHQALANRCTFAAVLLTSIMVKLSTLALVALPAVAQVSTHAASLRCTRRRLRSSCAAPRRAMLLLSRDGMRANRVLMCRA